MMQISIILLAGKAEWITDRTEPRMSTLPTLDPVVTPRWLRKHRQALRLRERFDVPDGETVRRLGPGFYVVSHRRELAEIARRQGVRPLDPERLMLEKDLTEEEWRSFHEAVTEARGR